MACLFFTACYDDDDDDSASNEVLLPLSAGWSIKAYETKLAELADDIAAAIAEDELQGLSQDFYASLFEGLAARQRPPASLAEAGLLCFYSNSCFISTRSRMMPSSLPMGTRSCSSVSRSRRVTVLSSSES